jgi:hypothetical protein
MMKSNLSGERIAYLGGYAGNYSTPGSLPLLLRVDSITEY